MSEQLIIFKTGIEEIDRQHAQLMKCLNELREYVDSSYGFAAEFTALNTLLEYTRFHFAYEEQLLAKWRFPGLEEHIEEHKRITDDVTTLWNEIEASHEIGEKLIQILQTLILEHINAEDVQYAKFLSDKTLV